METIRQNINTHNKESRLFMGSVDDVVIKNLSPLKREVDSLNEMEQIRGQFVVYKSVLAIKCGNLIA